MHGADELISRIESRLLRQPDPAAPEHEMRPDWQPEVPFERPPVHAAVLLGVVRREAGLSLLYTERSPQLRAHSGQVAFPGGKIDATDADAADAALREAWEEVGLERSEARVLGYMRRYFTGTNYLITPVVAVVEPSRPFVPNPDEVRSVFEVPLDMLMRDESYAQVRLRRGAHEYSSWQIEHGGFSVWGITANLTRRFRDLALAGEAA
ncbi:MAG TPA: CoA pyrophosphatase [Devosiaceae bacterium]|nr:CoA pyrophosphatase [Devosiaceae bacterium]